MNASESTNSRADCSKRWAPLSYPSTAIFSSTRRSGGGQKSSIGRAADPYFPLHRDVLLAAVREWLIMDGRIDPLTMKLIPTCEANTGETEVCEKKVANLNKHFNATSRTPLKRNQIRHLIDPSIEGERKVIDFSPFKKQRTRGAEVVPFPAHQEQKRVIRDSSSHTIHLLPLTEDELKGNLSLDHSQISSAEELVDYAVKRALVVSATTNGNSPCFSTAKESSGANAEIISPKRKVSDADDLERVRCDNSDFPLPILSLVRSNIMMLRTSQSGSKLSKLIPQSSTEFDQNNLTNMAQTDDDILSFLRHPKFQRKQQQGKTYETRLVLPSLLDVSIEDEHNLRAKAYQLISSMLDPFGNDLDVTLRVFLGYKSAKSPKRRRILETISNVLFDVSHAMYAWIHTEEAMRRSKVKDGTNETNRASMDMEIKASLFDDRALRRIGAFEPASLLPLALGIHRCREANMTWGEYALSKEGKMAASVHLNPQHEQEVCPHEEKSSSLKARKIQVGTTSVNDALLELGRKRRGRRGKSMISCQL